MTIRKSLLLLVSVIIIVADSSCVKREVVPITSFNLNYPENVIEVGETLQLATVVEPSDATVKKVTWSSSDSKIAWVTTKGLVTGIRPGSATITASVEGFQATCELTVNRKSIPATDIAIDRPSMEMYKDEIEWLAATITPEDSTDEIVWSSSNPQIVEVSDQGKLVALGCGTATITARAGSCQATCLVTVTELIIDVKTVKINKPVLNLNKGETEYLIATVIPFDATDKIVVWNSSDPSVASVNGEGKVTAEKGGSAVVTATAGGVTGECQVIVYSPVTAISLNARDITLDKGSTFVMVATVDPEDATDKTVTWTSQDNNVVSVNSNGVVSALKGGAAKIVAKAEDKTAECVVTVLAPVESVTLNKPSLTLKQGQSEILYATVGPEDATDKTVFWSSSNPAAVSVNDYGKVTAESVGTATITAKAAGITAECQVTVILP
ncbi:MAG: Ig-like domain-containing protein [Bacteroidales bacterium]|nr:Ig-like domain-containing protein [Bacteroidales bacterium]